MTYKTAIIGLSAIAAQRPDGPDYPSAYGRVTESHASVYHDHPQTELVAVCDIRTEALDHFRQSWGEIWSHTRYYDDYQTLLATEHPELVSVVTPDHLHADIVVMAANHGAKAILCEKPIATNLADADRMIAACAANGTVLSIHHTRRWSPLYQELRARLRRHELGVVRTMAVNFHSRRAMLFRNGGHMIDILHFLADAEAAWVWAEVEEGYDHFDIYRGDGGHDPNLEPSLCGYIHFANGVRAFYESAKTDFSATQFTITCQQGRYDVTDQQMIITQRSADGGWSSTPLLGLSNDHFMLRRALDELLTCVEHGGEPTSSGRTARQTVAVMLAMLQSHARGNVRVDLPIQ